MKSNLLLVKKEVEAMKPDPGLETCLLLQIEEQVGRRSTDLWNVIRDLLSSQREDEDLLDEKDRLRKSLFQLSFQIKQLLHHRLSNLSTPR